MYELSNDPGAELCDISEKELKAVASKYPGWISGLFRAVKRLHPSLRPNKLPPKKFDALTATAE